MNPVAVNKTILHFGGFPQILSGQRYPPPGNTALAERVAGLPVGINTARRLDHGAWVVLKLIFPETTLPCCSDRCRRIWGRRTLTNPAGRVVG